MKVLTNILMVFSSIGVINSIYFSILLSRDKRGNELLNKMLALLIMAFTIRIAKSVIFYFSDEGLSSTIINISFSSLLLVGPTFFIYSKLLTGMIGQLKSIQALHLLPALLLLGFSWAIPYEPQTYPWRIFYSAILLQIFFYLILVINIYNKYSRRPDNGATQKNIMWLRILILSVFMVWIAYFLHFPLRLGSYINGALAYTLIIYLAFYFWHILNRTGKHMHSQAGIQPNMQQVQFHARICLQLESLLMEENYYKQLDLSINKLAKKLNIPSYQLSRIINFTYNKNFNELINDYRIADAKKMLSLNEFSHLTIAAIAFDVGFNSLSSFNEAFKKRENKTPSVYKKEQIKQFP